MTCNCSRFPKPHNKQRLCGIGFNEFLGEVQHRLILAGYAPPAWPDAKIRDQGDLDNALDSCVQWCAARLDACGEAHSEGWKLVPVEPTVEMMLAALSEHRKWESEELPVSSYWPRIYRAMLAAAMSAQSDKEER